MKKYALLIPLCLLIALPVSAAHFIGKNESGYSVPMGTTLSADLYVAAQQVSVAGAVAADATIAAETVSVGGSVAEDLIAAGKTVAIAGSVGHDVRVAGQNITISGRITGDVIAFGETLTLGAGSVVEGDVLFFGKTILLNGEVKGEVHIWSAEGSFVDAKTGAVTAHTGKLSFTNAQVAGDVTYYSNNDLASDSATVISGKVTRVPLPKPMERHESPFEDIHFGFLLMALAMTALAVWLFAGPSRRAVTLAIARPGRNLAMGVLGLIATPVVAVILLVTIIGLPLGLLMLFIYGVVIILAKILSGILAGALLARLIKKEYIVSYLWAGLGIIVLTLVRIVPFVGWIPVWACFIVMVGVLLRSGEHMLFRKDNE